MGCIDLSLLVVIPFYNFSRYYYWRKFNKYTQGPSNFLELHVDLQFYPKKKFQF